MKPKEIDAAKLKRIFEDGDEFGINPQTDEQRALIDAYKAFIVCGVVVRAARYYNLLAQVLRDDDKDAYDKAAQEIRHVYFNRLYGFLENFDPNSEPQVKGMLLHKRSEMRGVLIMLKDYFEHIEDYVKCAKLRDILIILDQYI